MNSGIPLKHLPQFEGGKPFGLGLRLSAASAANLAAHPNFVADLRAYLADHNLYALTVNAFPYGRFHGVPVKDAVYQPDWTRPERLAYTLDVARVLAELLPEDVAGSISTSPLTFKGWPDWARNVPAAAAEFARAGRELAQIQDRTERRLILSIEPEPYCYPETVPELCEVFGHVPAETRSLGTLGTCFDTAHQAVEFEDLAAGLRRLRAEAIPVGKIQLSAALRGMASDAVRTELAAFDDPVYLHQACARIGGTILRTDTLRPMLDDARAWEPGGEIRVHYHVPLFVERTGSIGTTAAFLAEPSFVKEACSGITQTLEIETYTWHVWRNATGEVGSVDDGIAHEFKWVRKHLAPHWT
jgi:hypothetical protein